MHVHTQFNIWGDCIDADGADGDDKNSDDGRVQELRKLSLHSSYTLNSFWDLA
jgi:hypothetical protein